MDQIKPRVSIDDFYLKAKTSVGTIHLPLVYKRVTKYGLKLVFNWVVFEDDVTLYSYQPFAEVARPPDDPKIAALAPDAAIIEDYELGEAITLTPDDEMYVMSAGQIGRFTSRVPKAFILDLDPSYQTESIPK